MAPEVFQTHGKISAYKEPVDIWACGIIMYLMLAGRTPFNDKDYNEQIREICNNPAVFAGALWDKVPDAPKDLIRMMLKKNPA